MRSLILISIAAAALAASAPAASATRLHSDHFRVSFSGTQTTQVTGSEDCSSSAEGGGMVPGTASETATFRSVKSRVMLFERAGRELNIYPTKGYGETTLPVKATIDRQSQLAANSAYSSACEPQPNSSCGHSNLSLVVLVQGGLNQVSFAVDDFKGFEPGLCPIPLAFGFPDILPPKDYENHSKIKYSARTGRSLLNPHKHVVIVHGSATATNSGREDDAHVTSAVSKLKFTMRLVRVRSR